MANLTEYKCPCCGGAIEFDSTLQKMKCPYCDTEFEVDAVKEFNKEAADVRPDNFDWDTSSSQEWNDQETSQMAVYICQSCGGEIVADQSTGASSCPFCGNPVVMSGQFSGSLRPDFIIPFKLDKRAAKEGLNKHLHGKILLPKVFKKENHIDEIKGVYVPFWLFDTDATADIRYHATKTRCWSDSDYDYTETSHYSVFRAGGIGFDMIPVDGSSKIDNDLTESLEPFVIADAVPFQTPYLAGYVADKYDVSAEESVDRANQRVKKAAENAFRDTVIGYDTVTPEDTHIQLHNGKTHYALLPVWLLSTTWKGDHYLFGMNGQTGKFVGNLPTDKGILVKWLLGLTVGFSAVTYAIAWLIHML